MQDFATLNTPILNVPGAKKHHAPMSLVVLVLLAFVIGVIFWIVSKDKPVPDYGDNVSQQEKLRAEVAELLQNAKTQASPAEVTRIADTLSKSKATPTTDQRARVAASLENF
jgi:hypothetical protein